ncbi:unnamed protein product [Calypogeia fissa]
MGSKFTMEPKSIIMHFVLMLLTLQLSSHVGAVDIIFWGSYSSCSGSAYSCYGIYSDVCCTGYGGSVSVTTDSGSGCLGADYYVGEDCNNSDDFYTTTGDNYCLSGKDFRGADWFNACSRRRSLLGASGSKRRACKGQMKPNAVLFTEDGSQGHWALLSANGDAEELYSQLKNVEDGKKLEWMKAQGATYKAFDSTLKVQTKKID